MQYSSRLVLSFAVAVVAIGGMIISCGPNSGAGHGGAASGGTGGGGTGGTGASGGTGGSGGLGCVGTACQVTCQNGGTTTLTGKVFAPNGTLPLYNAIVYIPTTTPATFTDGATCDRCSGSVSGNPLVITQTDAAGSFTLTNVPVGNNVPLVIQLGKWRRQVTIASVPSCATTPLDAGSTSLPKNHTEGDMPQMAIATGSADPFECLLLKIGIDPAEITIPSGTGRVHFYLGETQAGTKMANAPSEGDATNGLFANLQKLLKYDVVMLPCEGTANYANTTGAQRQLLTQYLDAGGRVFSTHYSYNWLTYANSPYNAISTDNNGMGWHVNQNQPCGQNSTCGYMGTLDTSFPKGMAFNQWLGNVTMPMVNGSFEITDPRNDLDALATMPMAYAQRWMYHMGDNKILHTTFNTPLNPPKDDMGQPQYCGRVVFSDFHVSANEAMAGGTFPGACMSGALTTQEKALAFMLFDLSSCVQSDQTNPIP